jgi:hypothetical protein
VNGFLVQSHPENTVGVLTMAGKHVRVLVTPTSDLGKILACMHGTLFFAFALFLLQIIFLLKNQIKFFTWLVILVVILHRPVLLERKLVVICSNWLLV